MVAMASPQIEHGYTTIAHELLEWLMRAPLNGSQFRLLLALIRKTYGHKKTEDRISAGQFHALTGLHKQVVARELRELARRGYLVAIGDVRHAKRYRVQKDYTRWDDGAVHAAALAERAADAPGVAADTAPDAPELSTDPVTPAPPACIPIRSQMDAELYTDSFTPLYTDPLTVPPRLYTDPVRDLYTDPLTTKERKKELTDSHESGAVAPRSGLTLRERYDRRYREASNKIAVIGELFSECLGTKPDHGRLGHLSKGLNSGGKLMDLIIEASRQRISDDPHDYLAKMVARERDGTGGGGRYTSQADMNSGSRRKFVGA